MSRPSVGAAIVLVAASDPSLFRGDAFGSLTVVDLSIATVVARSAFEVDRRRPHWLEWCALGFLGAGGAATAVAHADGAPTAFLRVASYVIVGLAVGRALGARDRLLLARVFVGTQVGQALMALASATATTSTAFPFGRYLGTLGDPAQFGIPIAFAAVLLAVSPHIVRDVYVRAALLVILCGAVAGSVTRSAWAVLAVGSIVALVAHVGSGRSARIRTTLAFGALTTIVAGTILAVVGGGALRLNQESAEIRRRSIETAWTYLIQHPLRPLGLGNQPERENDGRAVAFAGSFSRSPNLIPDSSFENQTSGWISFRGAQLSRRSHAIFGQASLRISTPGIQIEEGIAISSPIRDLDGADVYTFSIYANVPRGLLLWLYVDEFDTRGRWLTHGYKRVRGRGAWRRFSRTWKTARATAEARLFVVTGMRSAKAFSVDGAQLERASSANSYVDGVSRPLIERSAVYNTWLAVAVGLGVGAAALLFGLAAGAARHAYRLGDRALCFALAAMLVPSLTENFVYAASMVTLVWLATLGLTAAARDQAPEADTAQGT